MVERYRQSTPSSSAYGDAIDSFEKEVLDHYETNREKHNDERDNIQKKTFTKWVNKHLSKAGLKVDDLFVDLRDGYALIALLEALTGERIQKENGYTRFHRIQNVQYCLDFLKKKNIKLVNIRPEDIVEGNGKLTLGLIWTIILNFQVSVIRQRLLLEAQHERAHARTSDSHTSQACMTLVSSWWPMEMLPDGVSNLVLIVFCMIFEICSRIACFVLGIGCIDEIVRNERRLTCDGGDPTYTTAAAATAEEEEVGATPRQVNHPTYSHACDFCDSYVWHATACLGTTALLLFGFATTLIMFKVVRSYSKKAERKQESSRGASQSSAAIGAVGGGSSQYYEEYRNGGAIGGGVAGNGSMSSVHHHQFNGGSNGQLMHHADNKHLSNAFIQHQAATGGFSESSSYETREHFERKVQRVKKTRGERERSRSMRRDEVSEALQGSDATSARDALLQWARKVTSGYPRVNVTNFSSSWRDGLAFNAILHRYRPNIIDWNKISSDSVSNRERLDNAFAAAEKEFGVSRLLDAEDVDTNNPDEKSIITYVSSLYNALPHLPELNRLQKVQQEYIEEAHEWREWVERATRLVDDRLLSGTAAELIYELQRFRDDDLPPKDEQRKGLIKVYDYLEKVMRNTEFFAIPTQYTGPELQRCWNELLNSIDRRFEILEHHRIAEGNANDLISRLERGIGITNEKLDLILKRIEDVEARVDTSPPAAVERTVSEIVEDLNLLENPIAGFFEDVEELKTNNHPEANDFYRRVYGLHQRRTAYLDRLTNQILVRLGVRTETLQKENLARLEGIRQTSFSRVEECIEWVRVRMEKLTTMEFLEDLETLETMFEQHKLDNRDIQDFRQNVDECIARQAEVSAEDTYEYCELLRILESEYQQLRDLSAGRMLDLDSLIAFVRAAQLELIWVSEREEIEVTRNWSDIKQLELPMLTNYYKQLLHEMELREKQYNDVHNQGAALLNQGHPAVHVIEAYLRTMQNQWDWLLALSKCLEEHLRDALNLKSFMEEAADAESWIEEQATRLENNYNRTDFSLEEGERFLRELDEIKEILNKYHGVLMALTERCATISPLWQRGDRIPHPINVTALCDYSDKNITIKAGDDVVLLDNSDLIKWTVRDLSGVEGQVPSVVFRIPPPDAKLTAFLNRLLQQFEKLKKLWEKKHRMVRFNMVLNTMRTIQGWDLDTFNSIDPDQRDAIMKALNDDANKLLSELDPNDPLVLRLREELRKTNEHFWNLLNASQKPPEPDWASQYDQKMAELLRKLEESWRILNDNVGKPVSRTPEDLERVIHEHKRFEDALQGLDADVANVKELFRNLPNPTPTQRVNNDRLSALWDDLWDLSRMYVERIKVLESVLNGMVEVADIVKQHEITLNSFDDLPAALDKLRGHHSQLLEINMVLKQQQNIIDQLNKNVALLRQHVARTRINEGHHPDVDVIEDEVQKLNVRWENVNSQIADRLIAAEKALQIQMVYRSEYETEMAWLDTVEETINRLRKPEELRPEQYQQQLDLLVAEYSHLQEHTQAIENVNKEGGKFIRDAKSYDAKMGQYADAIVGVHGHGIRDLFRRTKPQPKNGATIVTEELELLNRRFAQLSSLILERSNTMQVLIQNWKRQKQLFMCDLNSWFDTHIPHLQEEEDRRRAEEEEKRRAFEAARKKALEDAERLRREREAAERERRRREEEERRRREEEERRRREEEERRRREQEERDRERERLRREEEERRRREEEERRRREQEERDRERERLRREDEERRRREEEERRRREQEERDRERQRREDEERRRREEEERRRREEEENRKKPPADIHLDIKKPFEFREIVTTGTGDEFDELKPLEDHAKISEVDDEMQTFAEETIVNTQFYEMEGTLHKQTGEIVTFVEAIRQGLLDLHSGGGQFFDLLNGSKISLEKAAELGYIDGAFQEVLNTKWGINHPETGESITLLEAIQIGLYDPEIRQIRDINTREILSMVDCTSKRIFNFDTMHKLIKMGILKLPPMGLSQAIEQGVINTETGYFTGKYTKETMPIKDAIYHGYVQIVTAQTAPQIAITLTDAIENDFINANNGEFNDRNTNDQFTLRDAVSKKHNLLNMTVPEIVNTAENKRLNLGEALVRNAISSRNGNFTDLQSRRSYSLKEAHRDELICKPLTLTEASQRDLIDSKGFFVDRGTKNRYSLLEAISTGLLDAEVRHIVDPDENDVISMAEALERGVLTPNGRIVLEKQQKEFTVSEAIREGLLTKRVRHTIFDVKGIRNTQTDQLLSYNEAVEAAVIVPNAERVVDLATQESYLISDARAKNLIDETLHELLTKPVGIKSERGDFDLNLVRAVSQGFIDPSKGVFFNKKTKRELSTREAYQDGLLSLRGAIQVSALLDVPPSLMTPSKKIDKKKRISRPGAQGLELASNQVKVTIAEAMKQGLIDSRTQRFRQGDIDMSLDDALSQGLIDPASEWIVPARDKGAGPTIEEKTTEKVTETGQQLAPKYYPDRNIEESVTTVKRVRTTETTALGGPGGVSVYRSITGGKGAIEVPSTGYHIYEAERKGLIDLTTGQITAPNVDRSITFAEGIEHGIIDASTISVRDPRTGRHVGIKEALEKNLIEKDGSVNGRNIEKSIEDKNIVIEAEPLVPLNNQSKNIIQIPSGNGPIISFRPVGQPIVEESVQSWEFDAHEGVFIDHHSNERMTIERALASGKIAPEDISVRDALTGREMSFTEAEKWGIIDTKGRYYMDKSQNKRMSYTEAAQQHHMYPTGGVPDNAADAVHTTVKIQTRTQVAKKEALSSGVPLSENTLGKALALGWYDASSGTFTNPDTQKPMTLKESIIKGLFNPYDTTVVDKRTGKEYSLLEAIQEGLVDDTAGTVKNTQTGQTMSLSDAVNAGIIKGKNFGDSLDSSLFSGRLDLSTGHYTEPTGGRVPLHEALNKNLVDQSSVVVRDPSTGHEYSYREAVSRRIVDPDRGLIHNNDTKESTSFSQALTTGLLASSSSNQRPSTHTQQRLVEQRLQLTPFAPNQVSTRSEDGRHEFVDLGGGKQVRVKVVKGEGGVEKGEYVDPSTGMKFTIQMQGDPFVTETKTSVKSTSQVQSVELEPHAEFVGIDRIRDKRNNRIMSLEDAKRMGLAKVDKKGKQMTKSYQVFRSNIQNAVNRGIKDAHDEKISLEDAIRAGIVDIRNLTYRHPKSGESISLTQAANMGLIDVTLSEILPKGITHPGTNENISIKRAIDLGIVDPRTGEVRDPRTREQLTWLDILKTVYQAISTDGVFDPTKGHHVPVTSALNDGLINASTGNYHNPITGEVVPLNDAVERGLIDRGTYETITKPFVTDFRTNRQLNLVEAVRERLVDPKNRTIQLSRQSVVPIAKAIQDGRIPFEIGEKLRRVDKLTFAEALGKGLIDSKSNIFTDPDTGRQMTIAQAIDAGFIDTGSVEGIEGNDEKNLANVLHSSDFDENSGRIRDKKTGLYLTFSDAVNRGVIDGDSLIHLQEGDELVTLRDALNRKKIDSDGKFVDGNNRLKLSDAVRTGRITVIASPSEAVQAVTEGVKRRDAEGYKFKITEYEDAEKQRQSVPKWREQTTVTKLTPQIQEPGLSVRMRQSVTSIGDRARSFIDDPSTLADLQQDFLSNLEANKFDTDERIIENPQTHQRVSVREATETGLLDVLTGEIVHPETGRRLSIPKAVHMKLVGNDAAKRLMEGLNMPIEEVHIASQTISSTHRSPSPVFATASVSQPAGGVVTREYTKTINWHGQPSELRNSKTDPLAPYTSVTTSNADADDAPSWARKHTIQVPSFTSIRLQENVTRVVSYREAEIGDMITDLSRFKEEIFTSHLVFDPNPQSVEAASKNVEKVKDSLDAWRDRIKERLDAIDDLCRDEADSLTPEQFAALREKRRVLADEYENVLRTVEGIHSRLNILAALLIEFSSLTSSMQSWMTDRTRLGGDIRHKSADPLKLDEARYEAKSLLEEVQREEYRLKNIGASVIRIEQEIEAMYEDMRSSASASIPAGVSVEEVQETKRRVEDDYAQLLRQCQDLIQFQNRVHAMNDEHAQHARKADEWIQSLQQEIEDVERASVPDDERLMRIEELNRMAAGGSSQLDEAEIASQRLISALEGTSAADEVRQRHEEISNQRRSKHRGVLDRLQQNMNEAAARKAEAEGVKQAVSNLLVWSRQVAEKTKEPVELPLNEISLNEAKRDEQVLSGEIESKLALVDDLERKAKDVGDGDSHNALQECKQKLIRSRSDLKGHRDNIFDAINGLHLVNSNGEKLARGIDAVSGKLRVTSGRDAARMQEAQDDVEQLIRNMLDLEVAAKNVCDIPNVTRTEPIIEKAKDLRRRVDSCAQELDAKRGKLAEVDALENEFEDAKQRTSDWLAKFDEDLKALGKVSIDKEKLATQRKETASMAERHTHALEKLDELEAIATRLGNVDDAQGAIKGANAMRQVADLTAKVQQQDNELKQRAALINKNDAKARSFDAAEDEAVKYMNKRKETLAGLPIPITKDVVKAQLQELERMDKAARTEQRRVEEARFAAREIARQASIEAEAEEMLKREKSLADEWDSLADLYDSVRDRTRDAEKLLDECQQIEKWIGAKKKMVDTIGAPSTDAAVARSQTGQIQLMKAETEGEKAALDNVNTMANELIGKSGTDENNVKELVTKMDNLNRRWNSFEGGLDDKSGRIEQAAKLGDELRQINKQLKNEIADLESNVEKASTMSPSDLGEQLSTLDGLKSRFGVVDKSLNNLKNILDAAEDLEVDANNLAEIQEHFESTQKKADEIERKIDNVKKAALNAQNQEVELEKKLDELLSLVNTAENNLAQAAPICADSAKLADESKAAKEIYRNLVDNEGDFSLLKAMLNDELKKKPDSKLKGKLDELNGKWGRAVAGARDRKDLADRVAELVKQFSDSESALEQRLKTDKDEIEILLSNNNPNNTELADGLKLVEMTMARRMADVEALNGVMNRIEASAPGPDANRLRRKADKLSDDCKVISKRARAAAAQAQRKNDFFAKFQRAAEEVAQFADSQKIKIDDAIEKDAMSSERVQSKINEIDDFWSLKNRELRTAGDEIKNDGTPEDVEMVDSTIDRLKAAIDSLLAQLNEQNERLGEKKEAEDRVNSITQKAAQKINSLVAEISDLDPVGRSRDELKKQKDEVEKLAQELDDAETKIIELNAEWDAALDTGVVGVPAYETNKSNVDELNKLAARARKRLGQREKKLNETEDEIDKLHKEADEIVAELKNVGESEVLAENQQLNDPRMIAEKVKQLKEALKPIGEKMDGFNSDCKLMIKTAGPDGDTSELDSLLNQVGDAWSNIVGKVSDKEMIVDAAVQQMGRFEDAYRALLNWLEETEEMMDNQKAPSADPKVSKAQLHAYEVLLKHVEDKKASVDGFAAMIAKMVENTKNPEEKKNLISKDEQVKTRYEDLLTGAQERQRRLLDAVDLAERLNEVVIPLEQWMSGAEKRLSGLSKVPITIEKAKLMLVEQDELQNELESKSDDFKSVLEIAPILSSLVSVEDANAVNGQVQQIEFRIRALDSGITAMKPLLEDFLQQIQDFTLDSEDMTKWVEETEKKLNDLDDLPIAPDDLIEQSNILADITSAIADRDETMTSIFEVGRQLALQGEPEEALQAQRKLDELKFRYSDLMKSADDKIALLTKAIPLSDKFHEGFEGVMEWLDAVEQDLQHLDEEDPDTQAEFIFALEEDISNWRPEVDELTAISTQLQALCSPEKSEELLQNTTEMNKMVNSVADRVSRKAERIEMHGKQSRAVLDDLSYLVEWFADARKRIEAAGPPSIDPEFLRTQLKHQKLMNEEVNANKVQLRNVTTEAKKVARQLGAEGTEANTELVDKCDEGKELVDEVCSMCLERTELLERGLVLAEQLAEKFDDLNEWLDHMENELQNAPSVTTATPANELRAMHDHNNELSHMLAAYRPIIDRFRGDVAALQEICAEREGKPLGEIAGEVIARYDEIREAVRGRGQAIDNTMNATVGFGECLETLVSNLQNAADRLRDNQGISADPSVLEGRLAENSSIIESLRDKQQAYDNLKQSANELLASAPEGDAAAGDIENKLGRLDKLWKEIESEALDRGVVLEDVLKKAKFFWNELDSCQKAVDDLRTRLDLVEPATGQPQQIAAQQEVLAEVAAEMERTRPRIEALSIAGQQLANYVSNDEKTVIDAQVANVHGGFSTITALFAEKKRDLIAAMEEAMSFHDDLQALLVWLDSAEKRVAQMSPVESAKQMAEIGKLLEELRAFKDEVDEHGVSKERVVNTAHQLAADAPSHLAAAVRQPIAELNGRWTRLYATLAEREHKLESSLLQMGNLSDAIAQLTAWMDKTKATLIEIAPSKNSVNLRDIEIAQCKLAVISNDVHSHAQSVNTVNQAAAQYGKNAGGVDADTKEKLVQMNEKWAEIQDLLAKLSGVMEVAKAQAENVGGEVEKWQNWLEETEAQLVNTKPTGGLPETAEAQLDEFRVLKADVEQNTGAFEAHLAEMANGEKNNEWMAKSHATLKSKWMKVKELLVDREKKLQVAFEQAVALEQALNDMEHWIVDAERKMADFPPISRLPDVVGKQLADHESWMEEVAGRKAAMAQHQAAGVRMQYYCEKKDAIPIKNRVVSLKHRCEKISSRTAERAKQLAAARDEVATWQDGVHELDAFIADVLDKINADGDAMTSSLEKLKARLEEIKEAQQDVTAKQPVFEVTRRRGIALAEHATRSEYKTIASANEKLAKRWNEMVKKVRDRLREAEQSVLEGGAFEEAMNNLESWVDDELERYEQDEKAKVFGDIDGVRALVDEENRRAAERKNKENGVKTVAKKADALIASGVDESDTIKEAKDRLMDKWKMVEEAAKRRSDSIKEAEEAASVFDAKAHTLLDWLAVEEQKLKTPAGSVKAALAEVEKVKKEMDEAKQKYQECLEKGAEILDKCQPQSEQTLKNWIRVVEARWKEVSEKVDEKEFALLEEEQKEKEREEQIARLAAFAAKKREELNAMIDRPLAQDLDTMEVHLKEMSDLDFELREKQPEVDAACKVVKKGVRNPGAELLSNEWKKLWLDAMGLQSSLDAQKELLDEMKRLEGWKWEDWKERYVEWNDHAKARVSDLFRRIDRLHTGNVPRQVFIDGIIGSKFPTSRLEMAKVADLFDKGDGMINSKEFINALRFDSSNRNAKPQTDTEKITHEIERQKKSCSCCQPYQIEKISDNHYRFGDTHIKRMVRILRSTVMVRVGGGWESLDEFLHKHDPCRAKGRLNINMFPEAKPTHALDSMRAFTKNRYAKIPEHVPVSGTPGPIMKIREKTERSVPMSGGLGGTAGYTPTSSLPSRIPRAPSDLSAGRLSRVGSQSNSRSSLFDTPSRPDSRASSEAGDRQTRIPSLRSKKGVRYNPPSAK
ncbi:unnamed protein product [Caenorhabditis bovis]|uniref:Uncharacterized protein n=1 Tax=Caenorhabditis bovis TaxID=2654633 RepID=A0A8S1F7L7_9PELO|nr:unnamed protein product [Caenorhabditis bovis]